MSTQSANVQHGLKSWVDYDRPWLFQRQFLVSDNRASIISNFASIILTLAGPRLWILIKAFISWIYHAIRDYRLSRRMADTNNSSTMSLLPSFRRTRQYGSSQPTPLRSLSGAIGVVLTEESHSELGAARDVLRHVWSDLQSGEIQLSSRNTRPSESQTGNLRKVMTASWSRVKRIGNAFLHNITDVAFSLLLSVIFVGIFVAESTGSIFSTNIVSDSMALLDPSGCGMYMWGDRLQTFRRDSTAMSYRDRCYIKDALTEGCDYFYISTLPYIEINNDKCPFEGQACLGDAMAYTMDTGLLDASSLGINTAKKLQFRRKTTCTPLRSRSYIDPTENCTGPGDKWRPWGFIMPDGYQWGHNSLKGSDLRSIRLGDIFKMEISVKCVRYSEPRDDPIFPASERQIIDGGIYYTSNVTQTTLACVDTAQICDPTSRLCQDADIGFRYGWPNATKSEIWPSNSSATEMEKTLALLSYALFFSSTAEAGVLALIKANPSHMAKEQWKVEARRWFEISLARMQVEVFELAQMSRESVTYGYVNVMPPQYRGICNMVKFRSIGWRNVSVWGFFGVLFLVMGICLGSIKNGEETLWLVVAMKSISLFICWLWGAARRISWRHALTGTRQFVIKQWQAMHKLEERPL